MLVLIGVAPAGFVVNMNASGYDITRTRDAVNNVEVYFQRHPELLQKATGVEQQPLTPAETMATPSQFHCHPSRAIIALDRARC